MATLHDAARAGDAARVSQLLQQRTIIENINDRNEGGATALYIASQNGHDSVVRMLIDAGSSLDAARNGGYTALFIASHNGHDSVVRMLIDAGSSLDAATNNGRTALHIASQKGHDSVVRMLKDARAAKATAVAKLEQQLQKLQAAKTALEAAQLDVPEEVQNKIVSLENAKQENPQRLEAAAVMADKTAKVIAQYDEQCEKLRTAMTALAEAGLNVTRVANEIVALENKKQEDLRQVEADTVKTEKMAEAKAKHEDELQKLQTALAEDLANAAEVEVKIASLEEEKQEDLREVEAAAVMAATMAEAKAKHEAELQKLQTALAEALANAAEVEVKIASLEEEKQEDLRQVEAAADKAEAIAKRQQQIETLRTAKTAFAAAGLNTADIDDQIAALESSYQGGMPQPNTATPPANPVLLPNTSTATPPPAHPFPLPVLLFFLPLK